MSSSSSSGKLLGTAVGIALQNHEAIRTAGAPAVNAAGGVAKVLFNTFWKSIVVGLGLLVVWFASFACTYILGGTNFLGNPTFMALFGVFLFLILPCLILAREANKMTKQVAAKNRAHRDAAKRQQEARDAQLNQAVAQWDATQQLQVQEQPQR